MIRSLARENVSAVADTGSLNAQISIRLSEYVRIRRKSDLRNQRPDHHDYPAYYKIHIRAL